MLTDLRCRSAKARDKPYKLADADGLYLFVTTTGFKSWRLKYRFGGKERRLTFGAYPEVSLTEAREAKAEARRLIRAGVDPSVDRKQRQAEAAIAGESTFENVALDWHRLMAPGRARRYAAQILDRLRSDVFPVFGRMPIGTVTPALVLKAVRAIEARGSLEMAHRVRQHISGVFVFAIGAGLVDDDPAHVIKPLLQPAPKRMQPAFLKLKPARELLEKTEAMAAVHPTTKLASRLLALTVARPGVVRLAEQAEFEDLDGPKPIWRIPAAKMKLSQERKADSAFEFVVPLSRQAVETIRAAIEIAGARPHLFPSIRFAHRPMSANALGYLYRRAGFEGMHVPHGWRATFSTIMNELAAEEDRERDRAIIELMLAHVPDGVEASYNRAAYMPRRRELAQTWADMLLQGFPAAGSLLRG